MFRSTRTLINALTEKKTIANHLELYDVSGNNPTPLNLDTPEKREMLRLAVDNRLNNIKVYTRNMAEIIGKKALLTTPIILGGLTIASFVNGKYIKTVNAETAYKTTVLEFDEESLLSKEEDTYAHACFNNNFVDKSIQKCNHDDYQSSSSYATIYYGEGSDSLQVKFNINEDNTWEYNSHTNNLYQKSETAHREPIGELDEEYKQLIKDATETFIRQAELSDDEEALLREIVSNDENDVLVKFSKCVNLNGMEIEVHKYHWFRCLLAVMAELALVSHIVENLSKLTKVRSAETNYSYLKRSYSEINILKAAKKYREELKFAESTRISSIIRLLKDNGGDEVAIKTYEKRLSLYKKEPIELPEEL